MITVCGDQPVTLVDLKKVKLVTPPDVGNYWMGVRHYDFVDAILSQIRERKWSIGNLTMSLSSDDADLVGAVEIVRANGIEVPEGQRLCLGFMTSNARRRKMRIAVGSRVLVCNNGVVTGQIVMEKKHTTGFDLQEEISLAMNEYEELASGLISDVNELKEIILTQDDVDQILMRCARVKPAKSRVRWSRIWQVLQEWLQPTFKFEPENSGWALLNAFTYIVKKEPVFRQMDQTRAFHELILEKAGILAS